MQQDDKGLVVRGLLLLAAIGGLVAFVLTILFRQPVEHASAPMTALPELQVPILIAPTIASYPASIPWASLEELSGTLPSSPGWGIRYNAAATLARRGSPSVPWDLIREMLDEKQQMRNYRVRLPDGTDVFDEAAARSNVITALRALATWHEKQKANLKPGDIPTELRAIYTQVDRLAQSPIAEVKAQAEKARLSFAR